MEYPTRFRVTEVSDTDFTFVFSVPNGPDGKWRVWYPSDSAYRFEREDRGVRYLDLTERGPGLHFGLFAFVRESDLPPKDLAQVERELAPPVV